jgi:hypothetical protein
MTRFETTIVALAAIAIATVCSPLFAQKSEDGGKVVFDGPKGGSVIKGVPSESKSGKSSKSSSKARTPKEPEKPKEPTFTATGSFESSKDKAREAAILAAVEKLREHLLQQDPPVHQMPTTEMVRRMLVRHPDAAEADADIGKVTTEPILSSEGKPETMYKVEVAVRVELEHVRELRARERSSEALWVLAGIASLALVFAVFFRIDAWTKGYLTSWLVLGTIGAGALLAGFWWMAK